MFPTFVLMLGLAACAKPLILCLIGEKWLTSAYILQIVCLYAMLNPLHALNLNALQVVGRSDLTLKLKIIKTFLALFPITLGILLDNIYYMLLGSAITSLVSYYLNAYYSGPLIHYPKLEQIKDLLPSLAFAVTMAVPVYLISYIPLNPFILLPMQVTLGGVVVITLGELTKLPEYMEIKQIGLQYLGKLKNR